MKKDITVVVASSRREVLETLRAKMRSGGQIREARSTDGVYRGLSGAHLVIVDYGDLVEVSEMGRDRLRGILSASSGILVVGGEEFLQDPDGVLNRARAMAGIADVLPQARVALTGLAGGVGKTTLALSLARYFVQQTRLPAAYVELSLGPSGVMALLGRELVDLYEAVTQGKQFSTWEGITLVPMDGQSAKILDRDTVMRAWSGVAGNHVLTVFDAPAYHPLWVVVRELCERVLVVSDKRLDALVQGLYLVQMEPGFQLVLNRASKITAAALGLEAKPVAHIPDVGGKAMRFPPELGKPLMRVVYPGWRR